MFREFDRNLVAIHEGGENVPYYELVGMAGVIYLARLRANACCHLQGLLNRDLIVAHVEGGGHQGL